MKRWIQTYTGIAFDLQYPKIKMIDPRDIAHALAYLNRYGGHTKYPYSVAQHCVLMAEQLSGEGVLRREALMHDAHEAYMGDVLTPIKALFPAVREWEDQLETVVRERFGLRPIAPLEIREADLRMLYTEREQLLTWPPPQEWAVNGDPYPDLRISPWSPKRAEREFFSHMVRWGLA